MQDNGSPMRDSLDAAGEIEIWEELFPIYAGMQRAHAPDVERWVQAGAPDRRLDRLPALLEGLLSEPSLPLDRDRRRAIDSTIPVLEQVCAELASAVAQAIDHSDMHGWNVLIGPRGPRLADWGDSCVTHPFVSPFVTFQHAVAELPPADRASAAYRLRDAYLEAWTDGAQQDELRDVFAKATWVGHVIRALNFAHQLGGPSEWNAAVAKFLVRWQEQSVLLGRADELIFAVASERE